jgi:histidyl-tRNA synthetase
MAVSTHTFQTPKGTRDFYPVDLAVRRHLESVWRAVSTNHGFDEIDGPTFEHLDLYTVKSGPGIVSELFSFRRAEGTTDYALRPEFTPTLARMYAARAGSLPRPTRWFSVGPFFRAERPQRGRLREHVQWNIDVIGDESPEADAQVLAAAAAVLERLGLGPDAIRIKVSDRRLVARILGECGVAEDRLPEALEILDKRDRTTPKDFAHRCSDLGLDFAAFEQRAEAARGYLRPGGAAAADAGTVRELAEALGHLDVAGWCDFDLNVVRGLAYYTGTVFEIHEAGGRERAIAGGGRYDNLVELFGGPSTPAVGIAMGDVVIRLVLEDRGLLEPEALLPRPDAFVVAVGDEATQARVGAVVAGLRRAGLHVRHSSRGGRNLGKLLKEAARARSRFAVILGQELAKGNAVVKDLDAATQREVPLASVAEAVRAPGSEGAS